MIIDFRNYKNHIKLTNHKNCKYFFFTHLCYTHWGLFPFFLLLLFKLFTMQWTARIGVAAERRRCRFGSQSDRLSARFGQKAFADPGIRRPSSQLRYAFPVQRRLALFSGYSSAGRRRRYIAYHYYYLQKKTTFFLNIFFFFRFIQRHDS